MTFLSSRVIGRGSAAPPVDVALITGAFLSSFAFGPRPPKAGALGCQDTHPIRAGAAESTTGIGAVPHGQTCI